MKQKAIFAALVVFALTRAANGQSDAPPKDSATFDADGTAHITRVVPMPTTVSPEAQKWLESLNHIHRGPQTLQERRKATDAWRARDSAEARRRFPVAIHQDVIAGVAVDVIAPPSIPESHRDFVLINLHGGGFNADSGSRIEGAPIANLTKVRVIGVYYRLAPEHPFPAAVDDTVAVYKELLKTYKARNVGIFGTSAGASLTAEVAVRLKELKLPLPSALGFFSGLADFSRVGDSRQLFSLDGLPDDFQPTYSDYLPDEQYVGGADRKNAVLSPLFADLHGMPPTLLVTGTRDMLLSDTAIFHRALLRAGDDAQLVVFEAMPHAFWYHFDFPETDEALNLMAKFFGEHLGR